MNLLVTMAARHGVNLVKTRALMDRSLVWGLLRPDTQVLPSDIKHGFSEFITELLTTLNLNDSLSALRAWVQSWPDTWVFLTSEFFFASVYARYLQNDGSPERRPERIASTIAIAQKRHRLRGLDRQMMEAYVRVQMNNDDYFFNKLKRHFSMIDLFPDGENRFPISLPTVVKIIEEYELRASEPAEPATD